LFGLVQEMNNWLKADPENVVVMHCNSGKGRAGTACCCLLLFSGFFDNVVDCAKLFGARRFTDEKGVSQPCQVRFIHYFEGFYKRIVKSPQIKTLKSIKIFDIPIVSSLGSSGCTPFFEIYQVRGLLNELIYDNKEDKE